MSVAVHGYDSVGNISEASELNFMVDTKQPVLSVTETSPMTLTNLQGLGDLVGLNSETYKVRPTDGNLAGQSAEVFNLSGTVTDAFTPTMRLTMRTPNHDFIAERISLVGNTWSYTDTSNFTRDGVYCLWVEAEDRADNESIAGPYSVQATVDDGSSTAGVVYLPMLMNNQAQSKIENRQSKIESRQSTNRIYLAIDG